MRRSPPGGWEVRFRLMVIYNYISSYEFPSENQVGGHLFLEKKYAGEHRGFM
jgi:hypothetical protein